ncbi:MAG: esterase family protein [Gemmataceae bacterium]|nr:esterase family protein [Gemmataceae bacterium]
MSEWTTTTIAGKPAELLEPKDRRGALVFLHNAACQPLSFSDEYSRLLLESGLACVCPYGGGSWWTDRPTPEFEPPQTAERYVVEQVVPFVAERWGINVPRLGIFGISMGGQGALRLGFRHPELFPAVAAVAPAIEYYEFFGQGSSLDHLYESPEQARQDTVPMHIHPSNVPGHIFLATDPEDELWIRGADRLHEKLKALGVAHECDLSTSAGGHTWSYFDALAGRTVRFLSQALSTESRRLL